MITPEEFKRISDSFMAKNNLCDDCLGVGCRPEHFGMDNPNSQPCSTCSGRGYIVKQWSLP